MNPPYSKGKLSIIKALVEFFDGKNTGLLILQETLDNNLELKSLLKRFGTVIVLGNIAFKGWKDPLRRSVVLIKLVQPSRY